MYHAGVPCFYCHIDSMLVQVCLECRAELERMRDRVKLLERDRDYARRSFFRLVKEKERMGGWRRPPRKRP
jgi:hypothetical protein